MAETLRSIPLEVAMCSAIRHIAGSDEASRSWSTTSASRRLSVLAKSTRSRGVQWVLPPPTIVILAATAASGRTGKLSSPCQGNDNGFGDRDRGRGKIPEDGRHPARRTEQPRWQRQHR